MWLYVLNVLNVQSVIRERERGWPARQNTRQVGVNSGIVNGGLKEDRDRREDRQSGRREVRADDVLRQLPRGHVVSIGTNQETKLRRCKNDGGRAVTPLTNSTATKAAPAEARTSLRHPHSQRSNAGEPKLNPTTS